MKRKAHKEYKNKNEMPRYVIFTNLTTKKFERNL